MHTANGRRSAIERALDGSTYPSWMLVPSSLCKKVVSCMKHINLYSGLVMPSSGWWSPIAPILLTTEFENKNRNSSWHFVTRLILKLVYEISFKIYFTSQAYTYIQPTASILPTTEFENKKRNSSWNFVARVILKAVHKSALVPYFQHLNFKYIYFLPVPSSNLDSNLRHLRKDRLINGSYRLPCLSH